MIPQAAITQWRNTVPWRDMHQIEQDLILSRALVAIYNDDELASSLAFRGGTALHKLYLMPQARYSEDLDFVQTRPESIGPTLDRLRDVLDFLGEPKTKRKTSNNVMIQHFETTFPPVIDLRIKVEINCKEHFSVLDYAIKPFAVENLWFSGDCNILTYQLDELLGSKLRALYQRKKGRDLLDLAYACGSDIFDTDKVLECYRRYITFPDNHLPTAVEFMANLEAKANDRQFRNDVYPMLKADTVYDVDAAFKKVMKTFVSQMHD